MIIETPRLRLRPWRASDLDTFVALHADPEVMWDQSGPISRAESSAKFDRYRAAFEAVGYCRWALEDLTGTFLGYAGIMPGKGEVLPDSFTEIGWRLVRAAWGHGYATEAAGAALGDAFQRVGLPEVIAFTSAENLKSQAVMKKLGMRRDAARDFVTDYGTEPSWQGLVWVGTPT